jgi:transcriptional regulator with XRE-family HTH domain
MINQSNNIKKYRRLKGLTQKDLGDKLHVEHTTISNYETGKRRPDIETLVRIAQILDVDIKDLTEVEINIKKIDNSTNGLRQNIYVKVFNKEINMRNFLSQLFFVLISIIFFLPSKLNSQTSLMFFFTIMFMYILNDILRLIFPIKSVESFSVELNKNVSFENNKRITIKYLLKWLIYVLINLLLLIFISTIIYIGIDMNGTESNIDNLYSIFLIMTIVSFSIVLIYGFKRFKLGNVVPYDFFKYKLDLFAHKVIIILAKLLYVYSYTALFYFRDVLDNHFFWIFLLFPPILVLSTYTMYFDSLRYLSNFKLNITN